NLKHATTGLWSLRRFHWSPAKTTQDSSRSFHDFGTKMPSQWYGIVLSPVHRSVWHNGWSGVASCQQFTSPNSSATLGWIAKSCLQVGRSGPGQLLTVRLKSPPMTTSRLAATFLISSSSLFTCFQYASPFDGAWTLKARRGSAIPPCHDAPLISAPTTQP